MPDPQEMRGRKLAVVLAGLMLAPLIAALRMTSVATALPTIAGDPSGWKRLAYVPIAYLLATTVPPLSGRVCDLNKRRLNVQRLAVRGAALCGTPSGEQRAVRMTGTVRARRCALLDCWRPERYAAVARTLDAFAADVTSDRAEVLERARSAVHA